jgi:hypothetical protein
MPTSDLRLQAHFILLQQPIYGVYRWASGHATPRFLISQTPEKMQQLHYLEKVSSLIKIEIKIFLPMTLFDLTIFNQIWT